MIKLSKDSELYKRIMDVEKYLDDKGITISYESNGIRIIDERYGKSYYAANNGIEAIFPRSQEGIFILD